MSYVHPYQMQTIFDGYQDYITNWGQIPKKAFIEDVEDEDLYQDKRITRAITGKSKIKGMLDKKYLKKIWNLPWNI